MEEILKRLRVWGAPGVSIGFFVLWVVAENGRSGVPLVIGWPGIMWGGIWPITATALSIAVSAWRPFVSLGVTAVFLVSQILQITQPPSSTNWPIYIASFIALGFAFWTGSRRTAWIVAGANAAFAALMAFMMISRRYGGGYGMFGPRIPFGDMPNLSRYWPPTFAMLVAIAAGFAVAGLLLRAYDREGAQSHERRRAESNLRAAEVELVIEQERNRISRELHDVLAHSLAVIAAQADGARYLGKGQPRPVLEALETIAGSARRALSDAQHVISGARDDGPASPQPTLGDLGPLIDEMQGSLKVQRTETGTPAELAAGQQLAVYRIIQEGLTNALRHGGRGTLVRLHLDWSGPGLAIHLASALPHHGPEAAPVGTDTPHAGLGRGIPGMRERASLAGGWLTAGPDGGDFRVTAFIPYGARSDEHDATAQSPMPAGTLQPAGSETADA